MNTTQDSNPFAQKVDELLHKIYTTLAVKGAEYIRNDDNFHNFNTGATITNESRYHVLDGMLLKHYISYRDMLNDIKEGKFPTTKVIDEKLGDIITYFVLQKLMMEEEATRIENS